MKKSFLFSVIFLMFLSLGLEAGNHPPVTVHRRGGVRNWITFWKVTYHEVYYQPCQSSLNCKGSGNETCKTGYVANTGGDWDIDGVRFDEGLILMKVDVLLNLVDQETLPDDSPTSGSISKTYLLYDKAGVSHFISILAEWSNSNWQTGDADIIVSVAIIE